MQLTPAEYRFQKLLGVLSLLFFALLAVEVIFPDITAPLSSGAVQLLIVTVALLAVFCALACRGVRQFLVLIDLIKLLSLAAAIYSWYEYRDSSMDFAQIFFIGSTVGFALIWLVVLLAHRAAVRARFKLEWLTPRQALTLNALAEVTIAGEDKEAISADEVTRGLDHYLASVSSSKKVQLRVVFIALEYFPLVYLNPPMSWMAKEESIEFIKKRFFKSTGFVRDLIRGAKQLVYMSYYGNEKTYASVGFIKFEDRERFKNMKPLPPALELKVKTPANFHESYETDICIIGSGAAGAVLAYNLALKKGRRIAVLESGLRHVPQNDFTNIEPEMIAKLYTEGGLQLTQDFDLAILQGTCVGGTTVINNGICFEVPPDVLTEWDNLGASVDRERLSTAYADVKKIIGVKPLPHGLAGAGSVKFVEGCRQLKLDAQWFETNFEECGGSGYCNLGCKYNRKLSMLLSYLPRSVDQGVEIIADCRATKIETAGRKATKVVCRSRDGSSFTVRAKAVVVSCGTIASSALLWKSGIRKNVGTRVSFNIATPMHAEFTERLNSYDGVQMCCYIKGEGFLLETTFNPPAASALIMPGWFEEHFHRMLRYPYLATAAPVVGTQANGRIKRSLMGGADVDYAMQESDFVRLKEGMKLLNKVFLKANATAVYPSTFETITIRSEVEIRKIDSLVHKPEDVSLTSAHPQGGNPMSDNPEVGVVNSQCRVHGFDNLYVCDASVFPTSVRVNPQLTVMALAEYAAASVG